MYTVASWLYDRIALGVWDANTALTEQCFIGSNTCLISKIDFSCYYHDTHFLPKVYAIALRYLHLTTLRSTPIVAFLTSRIRQQYSSGLIVEAMNPNVIRT